MRKHMREDHQYMMHSGVDKQIDKLAAKQAAKKAAC